ncbi:unnamed protein product [Ectocarpus sp. 12 AP-2014]
MLKRQHLDVDELHTRHTYLTSLSPTKELPLLLSVSQAHRTTFYKINDLLTHSTSINRVWTAVAVTRRLPCRAACAISHYWRKTNSAKSDQRKTPPLRTHTQQPTPPDIGALQQDLGVFLSRNKPKVFSLVSRLARSMLTKKTQKYLSDLQRSTHDPVMSSGKTPPNKSSRPCSLPTPDIYR